MSTTKDSGKIVRMQPVAPGAGHASDTPAAPENDFERWQATAQAGASAVLAIVYEYATDVGDELLVTMMDGVDAALAGGLSDGTILAVAAETYGMNAEALEHHALSDALDFASRSLCDECDGSLPPEGIGPCFQVSFEERYAVVTDAMARLRAAGFYSHPQEPTPTEA